MKYVNKCCLYLHPDNQQCAYEAAQTFSQISSRFPAFSRHIKEVLEVYFRIREFHQARTKKKKSYKGKILVHYSLNDWAFLWVGGCVLGETSIGRFSRQLEYGS